MGLRILRHVFFIFFLAFSFIACSDDPSDPIITGIGLSNDSQPSSSSSSNLQPKSSSSPVPSTKPAVPSPIRVHDFRVTANSNKSTFYFSGTATVNGWDSLSYMAYAGEAEFTGIQFKLIRLGKNMEQLSTPLTNYFSIKKTEFPRKTIDFDEMDAKINDPEMVECGNYRLTVTLIATNRSADSEYNGQIFIAHESFEFTREEEYCSDSTKKAPGTPSAQGPIRLSGFNFMSDRNRTTFKFTGGAYLDALDTLLYGNEDPVFTGISLMLVRLNDQGETYITPLSSYFTYEKPEFPTTNLNFSEMNTQIVDSAMTECGNYRLFVILNATNDVENSIRYNSDKFVFMDSLDFTREEQYCTAPTPPARFQ